MLTADEPNSLSVQVELSQPIDVATVQGVGLPGAVQSLWLQIVLMAPFPDADVSHGLQISQVNLGTKNQTPFLPELAFNDREPLDLTKQFYPFGVFPTVGSCLYIGSREAFSKPNCTVTLNVNVTEPDPPMIAWEYFDGTGWSPMSSIADLTNGFTSADTGTISFVLPAAVVRAIGWLFFGQVIGVFVRGRLLSGTYRGFPSITGLNVADTARVAHGSSPTSTSIKVDAPNFATVGQVVQVDSHYAVVTNVDSNNQLTLMPALAQVPSVGASVQLKLTTQVATLTAGFTPATPTPGTTATLTVNISVPFPQGSVLLIDDAGNFEFTTVQENAAAGQGQITVAPPPQMTHQAGTTLAVVGSMSLPYASSNERFLFAPQQVTDANPFPPFGEMPGPGNFFVLYTFLAPDGGPVLATSTGTAQVFPFGRQVQLRYSFKVQKVKAPVDIAWEYLSAGGWVRVTASDIHDSTNEFVSGGPQTIEMPLGAVVAGEVNGQSNYWLRARINSGNYGIPLQYVPADPANPASGFKISPGSGNVYPPILQSLTLDYSASDNPNHLLTQNGFLYCDKTGATGLFAPFVAVTDLVPVAQADSEPTFYLGFDAAFPEQPVTLYVDAAPRAFSGRVMRETSVAPSLLDVLPDLRWEYFDGVAWHPLAVIDGTNNLTESGEFNFETPLDIAPFAKFDNVPRYWIRARSSANNPLVTQQLDGVFLNTTTAIQAVTVAGEILGSSNGQSDQTFQFARPPVLPGQQVTVREPEPPSDAEAAQLVAEEGADAIQQVVDSATEQTQALVRWHEVANFLASQPYSRHYTLNHTSGTLTFGALAPPIGIQNVLADYQSGGGGAGNLPAGAIAQVRSKLPAVASTTNPTPADGGADPETVAAVEDRGPQVIKHRGQAVAAADIEWLAREAEGTRVARAKCIPNVNQELVFEPGWATLLIVPNGTDPKPSPDSELIREVESYLAARAFVGLAQQTPAKLNVIGPGYIKVAVTAEVVPTDLAETELVKRQVINALVAYFQPLTGGTLGAGWPFGQSVYVSKVAQLIENTAGVDHIEALQLVPNLAQHRLVFSPANGAAAYLAQATVVTNPDRSKSALLADTADLPAGRVLIKGFKEGDEIAKVIDVTVQSVDEIAIKIGGFTDATGMPRGSTVMTFDGLQRTRLAVGILPGQTVSTIVLETALDVVTGDLLSLVYPFPMTVSAVTLEAIELTVIDTGTPIKTGTPIGVGSFSTDVPVPAGTLVTNANATAFSPLTEGIAAGPTGVTQISVADQNFASSLSAGDTILLLTPSLRLDIESYDPELSFDVGATITTLDNSVRLPLLQAVPAGQPVTAIRLSDFAAGDLVAPTSAASALAITAVEPAYDIVAMDDNFLIYSGNHQISMVQS